MAVMRENKLPSELHQRRERAPPPRPHLEMSPSAAHTMLVASCSSTFMLCRSPPHSTVSTRSPASYRCFFSLLVARGRVSAQGSRRSRAQHALGQLQRRHVHVRHEQDRQLVVIGRQHQKSVVPRHRRVVVERRRRHESARARRPRVCTTRVHGPMDSAHRCTRNTVQRAGFSRSLWQPGRDLRRPDRRETMVRSSGAVGGRRAWGHASGRRSTGSRTRSWARTAMRRGAAAGQRAAWW